MGPIRKPNRADHDGDEPGASEATTADLARIAAEVESWDGSAEAEPVPGAERGRRMASLAGRLGGSLSRTGRAVGSGTRSGAHLLADRLLDAAPRIPVRDLATLRAQHPGALTAEDLADRLTAGSVKASAAVGASAGAAALLPVPPAMPVEIASELLAVAAVELKLVAELYEVYGQPASGSALQRSHAYLAAWSERRGLDLAQPASLLALSKGAALRGQLTRRLARSGLRHLPTLTPLLIGAFIGARLNRRDTIGLAAAVRKDLRSRPPLRPDYWTAARPDAAGSSTEGSGTEGPVAGGS